MISLDYTGTPFENIMSSGMRSEDELETGVRELVRDYENGFDVTRDDINNLLDNYGYDFYSLPTYIQEMIDSIDLED